MNIRSVKLKKGMNREDVSNDILLIEIHNYENDIIDEILRGRIQ